MTEKYYKAEELINEFNSCESAEDFEAAVEKAYQKSLVVLSLENVNN